MEKMDLGRKPNILAVDDYPANLVAIEAVLGADCHIIEATSGIDALAMLETGLDVDVILMDLQMPEMDGYEAARRIKKIDHCKDIPIIFITAVFKEDPFVKKGYEAGGIDYFSKPFDPEILKMKVGVYASYRQKSADLKEREKQIRETEELLRAGRKLATVLETLPVGVLIADVNGRICQINDHVSRICKTSNAVAQGNYGEIIGWWDSGGAMIKDKDGILSRAIHQGEISHSQIITIKSLDGLEKRILGSASPLLGVDGKVVGAVIVIQDMTESEKIEADLEKQITKLVSAGIILENQIK